jgi:hypothetical protein
VYYLRRRLICSLLSRSHHRRCSRWRRGLDRSNSSRADDILTPIIRNSDRASSQAARAGTTTCTTPGTASTTRR